MTQVEILDTARDFSGGYKVDTGRGGRNGRVSSEWFSRPADERYLSLSGLYAAVRGRTERSWTRTVESAAVRVEASRDNTERLILALPGADTPVAPTHWSFGQLAGLVGAPAAYLRQLPAPLAGINLQYGLSAHRAEQVGTATKMRAMKNYAGSRLSPWLGHLMVSRQETARPLLTPGEMMQLPPTDEIVMVSGIHPVRAMKARYYEDSRFHERVLPPPTLIQPEKACADDWSARPLPPRPETADSLPAEDAKDDEDPTGSEHRLQPELNQTKTVEKKEPLDNEFMPDTDDDGQDDAVRLSRVNDIMRGTARQVSLDPADDMGL